MGQTEMQLNSDAFHITVTCHLTILQVLPDSVAAGFKWDAAQVHVDLQQTYLCFCLFESILVMSVCFQVPDLCEDLLSSVDQPLKISKDKAVGKDYLLCDYNRDGDSYRSTL